MSLDPEQIHRLAKLVRLKIDEAEAEYFSDQLSDIIELVEQMNRIDTDHVEPMSHPQDMTLRMREDAVTEVDRHQEFQAVAPNAESGLYLVPRVVE